MVGRELQWVDINWILHDLLHHSVELVHLNGGWALGFLSEEALESNNKFIRRYLEQYARTCSQVLQLSDAMSRLLERSDPGIRNLQKSMRNEVRCSLCELRHKTENHEKYLDL